jgi:hypothetical protein
MVLQTFRTTLPNVYRHLQLRPHFCNFLLQTGIFTNPDLDRQHNQLYDRILNHYLERYRHREMFGRNGAPDVMTDKSVEQSIDNDNLENLSLLPHKDGKDVKPKNVLPIINVCDLIVKSEASWMDLVDV